MKSILLAAAALFLAAPALAAEPPKKEEAAKSDLDLPPMAPDKTIKQTARIGGATVGYEATVGHIDVRDEKGKVIGQVVYTAYTIPGRANRPVTFAFNGGPGAASVYLNLGALGPKRVQFGGQGDAPSDSAVAVDNPYSWLDFTDLVFIDPIGTGFSRSLVDMDATKKAFWGPEQDIKYLSRVVYDWLQKEGRMTAKKYVVGESYGGYRAPRLAFALQHDIGVGVNGVVMVSPYLDPAATGDSTAMSPMPWVITLPSMAAAYLERQGKLSAEAMRPVEQYARTEYATDILAGRSDPQATARMVQKVTAFTGLDPALVQRMEGKVDSWTFTREVHRREGKIGSWYDTNVTGYDPFPAAAQRNSDDPILEALKATTTSAMVDFVTRQVGWKTVDHYEPLSETVNRNWDRDGMDDKPVTDLRKAIANDPKMGVLIVHGWDDLSCPYFASKLIADQMPSFGKAEPVALRVYPGGHMFYSRAESADAFKRDARAMYGL
ncbi:S10 family peptidase [Sphingomonas sp. ID0503]|uniref:S10 family peptidase n=1 Tax=Sphingomonas sp. ID0503 TaxID=3399691 RepID=UPI003AFB087A